MNTNKLIERYLLASANYDESDKDYVKLYCGCLNNYSQKMSDEEVEQVFAPWCEDIETDLSWILSVVDSTRIDEDFIDRVLFYRKSFVVKDVPDEKIFKAILERKKLYNKVRRLEMSISQLPEDKQLYARICIYSMYGLLRYCPDDELEEDFGQLDVDSQEYWEKVIPLVKEVADEYTEPKEFTEEDFEVIEEFDDLPVDVYLRIQKENEKETA